MRIANPQKMVTTMVKNANENNVYMLACSEPEAKIKSIYAALNYKSKPKIKQKIVLFKIEPEKTTMAKYKHFASG